MRSGADTQVVVRIRDHQLFEKNGTQGPVIMLAGVNDTVNPGLTSFGDRMADDGQFDKLRTRPYNRDDSHACEGP